MPTPWALPGDGDTIRGFSSPALIIEDEGSYVSDGLYRAIRPMLAVSAGRLILLGTPNGRRGHFFESWQSDETSSTTRVKKVRLRRIALKICTYLASLKRWCPSRMGSSQLV